MAREMTFSFRIAAAGAAKFAKDFSDMGGTVKALQGDVAAFNRVAGDNGKVIALRDSVESAAKRFRAAQATVKSLREQIAATHTPSAQLTSDLKSAEQAAAREQRTISRLNDQLERAERAAGAAGRSTKELARQQAIGASAAAKAAAQQQRLATVMDKQAGQREFRSGIRSAAMHVAVLGGTMGVAIKQSMDWEQRLAELNKVAGLTPDQMLGISRAAQDMAVNTGVAREEIIGAYTAAAQAGFARDEWEKFADTSAKMGVAFDVTGDDAGEMLKAWRSGMGLTMRDAELLAASANHLANNMNATAADVGQVLQRQGAVLQAAGIGGTDASALAASLLSGGATAEVAATAAKNFAKALSKGDAVTGNERQALALLGFNDPAALARQMQEAPREAILGVLESIKGLSDDEQLGVMTKLFGSESIGAIAPLVANLGNLKNAFALVGDEAQYASSLQDEFDAMGGTSLQNAKKFTEQLKVLTTQIGDVLKPVLTGMMAALTPILGAVSAWVSDNPKLAAGIGAVVGGATVLAATVLSVAYAASILRSGMLAMQAMMLVAKTSMVGLNVAMLANPIFLIIAGVTALAVAGVLLYKNWDTVSEFFVGAWASMRVGVADAMEAISGAVSTGMEWVAGVLRAGVGVLKKILWDWNPHVIMAKLMADIVRAPEEMIPKFLQSGKDLIGALVDGIKSMAGAPIAALKSALQGARDLLPFSDAKTGPLSDLTLSGKRLVTTFGEGVASAGGVGSALEGQLPNVSASVAGRAMGGGGGTTINVTQNITVNGNASSGDVRDGASSGAQDLISQIEQALGRQQRLAYG